MKKILSPVVLLFYISIFSQNPVDYNLIGKNIKNSKSEFYYPDLLARFQKGDTTLTLNQRRHLYYGYTFQEKFKKFKFNGILDTISHYEKLNTKESFLRAIELRDKLLDRNPFEAGIIDGKIGLYKELGNHEEFMKGIHQISMIYYTILSSGDGLSKETALVITTVSSELEIISILGFNPIKDPVVVDSNYEFIEVEPNDQNVKGIYFDVSRTTYRMYY